jgi:hypothetical protein
MKSLSAIVCLLAATWLFAGEVPATVGIRPGDTLEDVIRVLGQPKGRVESVNSAWFYYDQGEVRMRDNKVTEVSLISDAELQARLEAAERERSLRLEKGVELRDAMLADSAFASRKASERLAVWRQFLARYPEVALGVEYEKAMIEAAQEAEKEAEKDAAERRLVDLERRVRDAETQARLAEKAAEDARWEARNRNNRVIVPVYYPQPYVQRYPAHPQATPMPRDRVAPGFSISFSGGSTQIQSSSEETILSRFSVPLSEIPGLPAGP